MAALVVMDETGANARAILDRQAGLSNLHGTRAGPGPGVDTRADLYSLGALVLELLAKTPEERPAMATEVRDRLARHSADEPESNTAVAPTRRPGRTSRLNRLSRFVGRHEELRDRHLVQFHRAVHLGRRVRSHCCWARGRLPEFETIGMTGWLRRAHDLEATLSTA